MKKNFNEGNQIHNFMPSSGSGTVINYGSGSGSGSTTLLKSWDKLKKPHRLPIELLGKLMDFAVLDSGSFKKF